MQVPMKKTMIWMMGPKGEGFESEAIASAPYVALGETVERKCIGAMTDNRREWRAGAALYLRRKAKAR